jgi:hypothetical protein
VLAAFESITAALPTERGGVLLQGRRPHHRDLILTKEEHAANRTMMICCSGAKGDRLVLDL